MRSNRAVKVPSSVSAARSVRPNRFGAGMIQRPSLSGSSRYVGRVGALAVSMGVGVAVLALPAAAFADGTGSSRDPGAVSTASVAGPSRATNGGGPARSGRMVGGRPAGPTSARMASAADVSSFSSRLQDGPKVTASPSLLPAPTATATAVSNSSQAQVSRSPSGSAVGSVRATVASQTLQNLQTVNGVLTQAFASAGSWLDGLPANGFTQLLQAGLLMVSTAWTNTYNNINQRLGMAVFKVPQYDHVVVVMLENHSFEEILGIADTNQPPVPYINDILVPGGALMTAAYGLQHPSQPNYYWTFSGSNQGITTDEPPILVDGTNTVNSTAPNLYTELQALSAPKTFMGYVEGYTSEADLRAPGGNIRFIGTIASEEGMIGELVNVVRHIPWAGFANVPKSVTAGFTSFGLDFATLPNVSFVIPALQHDMHNYGFGGDDAEVSDITTSDIAMSNADIWLEQNISAYAQWALTHNSLLIITTDEDSTADWVTPPLTAENYSGPDGDLAISPGAPGFTSSGQGPSATADNPSGAAQSGPNQIFTLFYGAHVIPGSYLNPITNVNVLRTIEASMGITTTAGAQPQFAGTTADGIHNPAFPFNDAAVTGIFSLRS